MSKTRWHRFIFPAFLLCFTFCFVHGAGAQQATLPIMPLPANATSGQGEFLINEQLNIAVEGYSEPRLVLARQRFLDKLSRETGILFAYQTPASQPQIVIKAAGASKPVQELGEDESYHLAISTSGIELSAANPLGILRGLQTVLQLVHTSPHGFAVPALTIDDKPRFPWRGLMIDAGRHFIPIPVIEHNLDAMEAVKLNVLHWHLSEDQGFRVESKVYPLLTSKGSDGLFYTQDQVRHIIDYAHERGIRVVPEFDMPGHASAWFVGYPNLASGKGPYHIERHWGVFDPAMDPTRESTYQFLNVLIGEMTALFPDRYFHVGGDECNGKEWDVNPRIQEFMKAHNLRDDAALQAYFSGRVQKLVAARHKIMEGWDEVLQPDTPKDVVIQSWRGRDSLLDAAKRGYRGLLSNGYYIDLSEPAERHYLVDPLEGIADKLTTEQTASILGGEATIWSEYVSPETVDSRIWPRMAAIAERFWSPEQVRDVDSMYERLDIIAQKLNYDGIHLRANEEAMLERMSGEARPEALRVLASVVEPPKGYTRGGQRDYTSLTPLNRLVDAVPPESETVRQFREIVKRIIAGTASVEERRRAHDWLVLWRTNDTRLQPMLATSDMTQELVPVSQSLAQTAQIGLNALEALQRNAALPAEERQKDIEFLKAAQKPQAVLLLMVAQPIESLVEATKAK